MSAVVRGMGNSLQVHRWTALPTPENIFSLLKENTRRGFLITVEVNSIVSSSIPHILNYLNQFLFLFPLKADCFSNITLNDQLTSFFADKINGCKSKMYDSVDGILLVVPLPTSCFVGAFSRTPLDAS